jgi:hypothetical protein
VKKTEHDVEQLITLLDQHKEKGLDWYEIAVLIGWPCITHGNARLAKFERAGGPVICQCVRNRIHGARIAARRYGHIINWIRVTGDGRRDVYTLDIEGNREAAKSRVHHTTSTRFTMYVHDIREYSQVSRNKNLTADAREQAGRCARHLRFFIDSQNDLRERVGLKAIELPDDIASL